jgi:hypothetical protein
MDHEVSHEKREYITFSKDTVTLFVDICDWCAIKNKKKHFDPSPSDIRKMLRAMKEEGKMPEDGPSLEDLL